MHRPSESGNVIILILLAIVLIGLVTAAIRSGGLNGTNIDKETVLINATRVQQYASELERAVRFVMQNEISEVDIRFAHPEAHGDYGNINTNPLNQVFNSQGGGAEYKNAPPGVQVITSDWEFYGNTHLPDVSTARAELIAVLPNVTLEFCQRINEMNGYTGQPTDTAPCLHVAGGAARFDPGTQFDDATTNTTNEASFSSKPAMQACVDCTGTYHFYHVLMAR